jgi:hypothetical protein
MKKIFLAFLLGILIHENAFSAVYTTINNGNWNNTTNVWSLDGVSSCNCSPNPSISADTIVIQNNITITNDLTINNNGLIRILTGGTLANASFKLIVLNGQIISNGTLTVNEFNLGTLGIATLFSSSLNVQNKIVIDGIFTSNFSNSYVTLGNILVNATGSFVLENNSKLRFLNGNFTNYGSVSIENNCCLQLNAGNIKNEAGGTFSGNGSVISDNGNIKNFGTWSPLIKWCAAGASTGMTSLEDCAGANASCNFAPLPTELVSFDVLQQDNANIVNWFALSEKNGDFYSLERSKDGINWDLLTRVDVINPGGDGMHYMYIDNSPLQGISYYKLKLISVDGNELFTAIVGINANQNKVVLFPNPTTDFITVQFTKPLPWVKIAISDASGQVRDVFEGTEVSQQIIFLPYPCGLYFVSISSESFTETMKVIKN